MQPQPASYARRASGLVRQASLVDLLLMGLTGATIFYVNYFLVPIFKALLPAADLGVASIFTAIFAIPAYFIYAGFGTAMPRAGGDYLYQSRGLHPMLGFSVVIGWWVLGSGAFLATGVLALLILMGLYPIFLFGGLSAPAAWISSSTGLVVTGVAAVVLSIINGAAGIKWIARVQRYIALPMFIVSGITIPVILGLSSPAMFHANFNHYSSTLFGKPGLYETVSQAYTLAPFNWPQTILLGMILGDTLVMFSVASAPLLGEIKGANNFKGVWSAYFWGGTITAIAFMLPQSVFLQKALGENFLQAISQAGLFGSPAVPFFPTFALLTDMATTSYPLIILASLGYIAVGYYIVAYDITWLARIWLGTSLDNLTPRALGATHHRTHSPLIALVISGLIVILYIPLEAYLPSGFTIVGNMGIFTSGAMPLITSLAAIAFPFTQRAIYKSSPISKYRGVLRASGAVLAILLAIALAAYGFYPPLQVSLGPIGFGIIAAEFIGCAIWFFAYRAREKRKGIDVDLAFKELPME